MVWVWILSLVVFGLWSLVFGLWSLVFGLWSLVFGLWSLVFGLWSLVFGLWSLVFGLWSLVFGLWSLVLDLSLGLRPWTVCLVVSNIPPPPRPPSCVFADDAGLTEEEKIKKILAEGDKLDIENLTATSIKTLLLAFEKRINTNQMMRMKYPDEPIKFMDSEIELDEQLKKLRLIAASPHLYPEVLEG